MGVASYLDLRTRLAVPDTPPEILVPDASSYSSRQSEERSWNPPAPLSPPMSNYDPSAKAADMSAGRGPEEAPARRDVGADQGPPRQQLPSLSSLFGPPPPARSFHSPVSDRPGSYSSNSPLDRPPLGPVGITGRSSPSSYFPPSTTVLPMSQPRSAPEPRFSERPQFPPLSQGFGAPVSPLYREIERQQRPAETPTNFVSVGKWSARSGSRDYQTDSRDSQAYKSPADRFPAPPPPARRDDDSGGSQRDQPRSQSVQGHSKTSDMVGDIPLSKDGLGPKIWTGTHFLPRFVRAAEVAGEGLCYFYDDGSHCKTVIDGEAVNAHWGVTKAGKPRKRLAIACVTCREKKIKCDPDYPRCVQCDKFGRVCAFKNAPRGGHNTSPSTPPAEPEDTRRLGSIIRPPADHMRPGSHSSDSMSPRVPFRPASPDPGPVPAKRMRVGYDHYTPTVGPRSPMAPTPDTARSTAPWHQPELPRIKEDVLCRAWQTDPYVSDPESVTSTISSFFRQTDAAALRFLPEGAFTSWVKTSAYRKSPEDLMLIYSILAVSVALSGGPRHTAHEYSQVARYAVDHGALSIQLVQSRILLSLYYLAISHLGDAIDMSSSAISAAMCVQLNLEFSESQDKARTTFPFDLTEEGYIECRTRTFWSCFILERLNGLFPTRIAIIQPDDVFIRLPADVSNFEAQRFVGTPAAFDPYFASSDLSRLGVGAMGYLVELVAIWGDIMSAIYRLAHRSSTGGFNYEEHHRMALSRLHQWKSCLPPSLQFSPANLSTIVREDQGTLVLMHVLYHLAVVKLHRHLPRHLLDHATQLAWATVAQDHGRALLDIVCVLAKDSGMGRTSIPPPFTTVAIMEATDVLTAEGGVQDLAGLVDGLALAHSVLDVLGSVWDDAKVHQMAMSHRIDMLVTLCDRARSNTPPGGADYFSIPGMRVYMYRDEGQAKRKLATGLRWQIPEALECRFPQDMDIVYRALTALEA